MGIWIRVVNAKRNMILYKFTVRSFLLVINLYLNLFSIFFIWVDKKHGQMLNLLKPYTFNLKKMRHFREEKDFKESKLEEVFWV